MKKILIIAAAMLLSVSAFAQKLTDLYESYSDRKGVSAVYISSAMFRLVGGVPNLNVGKGVSLDGIINKLDGMFVLSSDDAGIAGSLEKDFRKIVKDDCYELALEVKEDGDNIVKMYEVAKDDIITEFVMLAKETSSVTLISFRGVIPRKDFEKAMNNVTL